MKRRNFLKKAGLGAIGFSMTPFGFPITPFEFPRTPFGFSKHFFKRRPNIILIFIDDLGWKDTGFMGSSYYETPNIDKLADGGIVFTNAYSNAPNCAPTRASLLTGQYTPRHGIYTVNSSERGKSSLRKLIPVKNKTVLDPEAAVIPEILKSGGYICAHIGKWHLGDDPESGPLAQGFDINIAGNHLGHPKSYFSPYKNDRLKDGHEGEYLTDRLTDEAAGFIDNNKNRPFFLYLSHYAVHTPIQPKKEILEKYRQKTGDKIHNHAGYAAMIESADRGVGKILHKLGETGLSENTVIFFFSDNGGHGNFTSMEPLRGSKGMLYEGGIRIPFTVNWPGVIKEGLVSETPVITVDIFPTILEIAGVLPKGLVLDGENLMPLFKKTGNLQREAIYWHFPAYLEAYKGMEEPFRTTPAGAVRIGDWKLIEFFEDNRLELYNLRKDTGEKNNLAEKMPEKRDQLHEKLKRWRKSLNAPVPSEKNPEYDPDKSR